MLAGLKNKCCRPVVHNRPMRAGMVAMVGKPNVGKSTLLNAFVGQKVSIVSDKPQTTRRRVLGIAQGENYQIAFLDTPGIHEPHTQLGRSMVDAARQSLGDVDLVLVVVDSSKRPDEIDKQIAALIAPPKEAAGSLPKLPVLLCMNKMDKLRADMVQPQVEAFTRLFGTEDYMMTVATTGVNLEKLREMIVERLPEGDPLFPEDEFTDQPLRFMASELIREKVLTATRQEVPHATAVVVDEWEEGEDGIVHIAASIIVEKQGQKAIIIGRGGQFIRDVGTKARLEIEQLIGKQVFLDLHVKVREDWRMNPRMLREMEYSE
jgi:GTPase